MKLLIIAILFLTSQAHAKLVETIEFDLTEVTIEEMSKARKNLRMSVQCLGDQKMDDIRLQSEVFNLPENLENGQKKIAINDTSLLMGPAYLRKCASFNRVEIRIEGQHFFGIHSLAKKDIYELLYSKYSKLQPGKTVSLKLRGKIEVKFLVRSRLIHT